MTLLCLSLCLLILAIATRSEAQYADPYVPRGVAQFEPGDESHGIHHWHEDLDILREWQQEYAHWLGRYNLCARQLVKLEDYWPENPVLKRYEVSRSIIFDDFFAGTYPTLIESVNQHIKAGHVTEDQFAAETYQLHLNYCHCQAGLGISPCDASFLRRYPYRYVQHVVRRIKR